VIPESELAGRLTALPQITISAAFWRTVPIEYLQGPPPGAPPGSAPQPLWPGGPARNGARYTPIGGCNALYLAPNGATALAEVEAIVFGTDGIVQPGIDHNPLLVFETRVELPAVVDLCDGEVQRALETSSAELQRPWLRAQERHRMGRGERPPTQALGQAACETGTILALRYPSYRHEGMQNLVVFTDRLAALGGCVTLMDASGTYAQTLP
jgi:RES domain-containing protein